MNREELLRKLRDLAQELGKETLTQKDIRASEISTYWIGKHFRNLASALEAAGLQPSKLARSMATSDEELLDYLDDLQRRLGQRPTYLDIDRDGRFSQRIFSSRFGSLENALSKLKERGVPVEERPRMQPRSREELIRKLQEIAQQHGDKPLREKDIKAYGLSPYWIRKHFQNLGAALETAGLQPSKLARSMATSDEELLDYLDDLQRRLGRRPIYLDIDREGRFSQRIFTKRFGSLENALSQIKERQVPVEEHPGAPPRPLASSILQAVGELQDCEKQARALEQTIERLTEENKRLQAELVASEAPERRITDGKLLFVHTSPDFHNSVYGRKVTSIKDTVANMLGRAERSVRISTLQIDMFTSELIALKRRNPELEITVLMRAKPRGDRSGIATRAISVMSKAGIKVHIEQEYLHSRMLVIDNKEVLVSSADLDYTHMDLEFNAGIWTTNSDVVDEAISYFDNILNVKK